MKNQITFALRLALTFLNNGSWASALSVFVSRSFPGICEVSARDHPCRSGRGEKNVREEVVSSFLTRPISEPGIPSRGEKWTRSSTRRALQSREKFVLSSIDVARLRRGCAPTLRQMISIRQYCQHARNVSATNGVASACQRA